MLVLHTVCYNRMSRVLFEVGDFCHVCVVWQEALQAFQGVMESEPDEQAGLNQVVCCFALGDKEKMKRAFLQLLDVSSP